MLGKKEKNLLWNPKIRLDKKTDLLLLTDGLQPEQ
jgi:hypothetical protein